MHSYFEAHIDTLLSLDPHTLIALLIVGLLFLGEPLVLIVVFFLTTQGFSNWVALGAITILCAVIAESFWFWLGRKKLFQRYHQSHSFVTLNTIMLNLHLDRPLQLLLFTRIFSGVTIAALLYLGAQKISYLKFVFYSTCVNFFWTTIVITIGYAAGKGYHFFLDIFESVHKALALVTVFLLMLFLVYQYMHHRLARRAAIEEEALEYKDI